MHLDPNRIVLVALGEGSSEERAHVAWCPGCGEEVDSLSDLSAILGGEPMLVDPPRHVWTAIQAAIQEDGEAPAALPQGVPEHRTVRSRRDGTTIVPTRSGRRLAGASLLAVGVLVGWVGTAVLDDGDVSGETMLASVRLEALREPVAPATARLMERDGERVVVVEAGVLPDVQDGHVEVWLLKRDMSDMVAIGRLERPEQEFVLPAGVSTEAFELLDVSMEPDDGDPGHSGDSLWRGSFVSG